MKVDPRFITSEGPEIFTGSELLLKGALETAGGVHLLGGYPGSPIAGFFDSMGHIKDLLNEKGIRCVINNNEALATAMLNGSQTLGCRGMIVMKSVGVHVAADALALGNLAGADPRGGAVVVYGDDPWSDSTQVAADSRFISKHLFVPVIEPSNPQEVKDFVSLSFQLSAASELYAGYVLTTNLADGGGTVTCRANEYPKFNTHQKMIFNTDEINLDKYVLLPPKTWWQEESLPDRFERAIAAARRLGLNRIEHPAKNRKPIGFITSGLAHSYLSQTLWELGLLGEFPILKFGLSYPLDEKMVRELSEQCERIVVVEERRSFLEEQVNEIALRQRQSGGEMQVWGKKFPDGLAGIPWKRGLHPSILISRLVPLLKSVKGSPSAFPLPPGADALDREIETIDTTARAEVGKLSMRTPTFCPGCPHRDSSALCLDIKNRFMDRRYMKRAHKHDPVDLVFHGDIGCYTMLMFPPTTPLMHNLSGMGLGGGTGSGVDPFITNKQAVFMGDSTFFHSGQLAISQAIKFGQDITFIILDNRTTAMTGHQPTPGVDYDVLGNPTASQDIEEVVRGMAAGNDIFILRTNPENRGEYEKLLERTFLADGVKIIIADKECGITRMRRKRRADRALIRKLGYLPRKTHMNVNVDICRFCLTCVEFTGCPGLRHVMTDYGRKMDTDITWCVNDGACERVGACSAFEQVTVKRKKPPRSRVPDLHLDDIPEPHKKKHGELWRCCLVGVGGMGIGLATSIIVRAGHKEGYKVIFVDKKGLAIRNGGVVSQVVYNISEQPTTALIPYGKADLLIGVDVLEAARAMDPQGRTRMASPERTAAVVNTDKIATIRGLMGEEDFDVARMEEIIRRNTRQEDFLARNISRICEKYLGSKLYTNIMMLGFAFQKGLIPVSMHSMAWAIKDAIRTDFRKNLYAFNMGRKLCERMDIFQGPPHRTGWKETLEEKCRWTIRRYRGGQAMAESLRGMVARTVADAENLEEQLKRDVVVRAYDCMRWGGLKYARRYLDRVRSVLSKDSGEFNYAATRAVVHNLASAMLIKDAVFTAELATSPEKYARDREKYNVNPANGDSIIYHHLWNVELNLWPWRFNANMTLRPATLQILKRMRWLRTLFPLWRRQEKRYLRQYEKLVDSFAFETAEDYRLMLSPLGSAECMNCTNARCREAGCPLGSAIPQWVQLFYQDRRREAFERLQETNNFPEFTARICPAFCESSCKQSLGGFSVKVRDIEKQIVEQAFDEGWVVPARSAEKTSQRVAIVGSGPAALAAAQQLARSGHEVVIFEKDRKPGGLLRYGIPQHRLGKELIDRRIEQLRSEGVEFRMSVEVGRDVSAAKLQSEFDAVLLAIGAWRPKELDIPGRDARGVHQAIDFLRAQNAPEQSDASANNPELSARGKVVAVIGGGLTGEDCVEMALAGGAREVHQLEILPEAQARPETATLRDTPDDVLRRWCVLTKRFDGDGDGDGALVLQGVRIKWTPSTDGPVMTELPESEFSLRADMALLALGFDPAVPHVIAEQLNLALDENGLASIHDFAVDSDGVFVAGDLLNGASYVATAIDSGRKAAERICRHLAMQRVTEPAPSS